jgi:uncharacterized protein
VKGKLRVAPCPRCGNRASLETTNAWRPFCSERCKMIDLGKWASEQYSIPAESQAQDGEEPASPETPH